MLFIIKLRAKKVKAQQKRNRAEERGVKGWKAFYDVERDLAKKKKEERNLVHVKTGF